MLIIITAILVFFAAVFFTGNLVIQTKPAEDSGTSGGGSAKEVTRIVYQLPEVQTPTEDYGDIVRE
jgi:hypothetical protein